LDVIPNSRTARADLDTLIRASDPIPTWLAMVRKCVTLSTVVRPGRSGPATLDLLDIEACRLAAAAHEAPSLRRKILQLWKIEGLVFRFFEGRDDPKCSLRKSSMPLSAGPPAHCGLAMAIVLQEGFNPQRLHDRFEITADPRFVMFCYETTGLMLAIAESGVFGGLVRGLGSGGLLRHRLSSAPENHGFLDSYTVEQRRLAAHGFGRALYFTTSGFSRAVLQTEGVAGLPATAALHGLNSANSLINCRDLDSLMASDNEGLPPSVAEGLDGGLFNTLCLLEWAFPGCSGELGCESDRGARIVGAARAESQKARDNELGPPMKA
jgi:hypothetical protein